MQKTNINVRKEVLKNHQSFWLNWNYEILLKRIKNSPKRPIAIKATNNELINLIKKRSKLYSKAVNHIDCDTLSKINIAKKIINIYENN